MTVKLHKAIAILIILELILLICPVSTYADVFNDTTLLGFWQLNSNANDSSTNLRNGTLSGISSGDWIQGRSNYFLNDKAINYAKTSTKFVAFTGTTSETFADVTISGWINLNNWINQTNGKGVFGSFTNTGNPHLYIRDNGKMKFEIKGNTGGTVGESSAVISSLSGVGKWNHIAVTYSSTTGTVTYYINGASVGTYAYTTTKNNVVIDADFRIGTTKSYTGVTSPIDGKIDDVTIYQRVLTSNEILSLSKSNNPSITTTLGTVSNSGTDVETITDVLSSTTLDEFKNSITLVAGTTFEVYEADGTTIASELNTGYKLISTAADGVTKITYTINIKVPSKEATVMSNVYKITVLDGNKTIKDLNCELTLKQLKENITISDYATIKFYKSDESAIEDESHIIMTGDYLIITSEDNSVSNRYDLRIEDFSVGSNIPTITIPDNNNKITASMSYTSNNADKWAEFIAVLFNRYGESISFSNTAEKKELYTKGVPKLADVELQLDNPTSYKVKFFLWEDEDNLRPLINLPPVEVSK